jgi:hypothetical protein
MFGEQGSGSLSEGICGERRGAWGRAGPDSSDGERQTRQLTAMR